MNQNNKTEMWVSLTRPAGDLAGIFESDSETGYFYLYKVSGEKCQKVIDAIHIISGMPDFEEEDIEVRWSTDENIVGLFIRSQLWAAFDSKTIKKYGGNYKRNTLPIIPPEISGVF
jgi:hypothetical protein